MTHIHALAAALAVVALSAAPARSQGSIASRVSQAPDGIVRLQFTGHEGVCGDGRDLIGYRKAFFSRSVQSFGKWSAPSCAPGPVRVSLTVSRGRITQMQTFVGGGWAATSTRVTDLGTVPSSEAASYFFGIVPDLEGRMNKARFLLPAVLASDNATVARLVSLARDGSRAHSTRQEAIQWIGLLGDASAVPTLVAFARQGGEAGRGEDIDEDDDTHGKKGLATAAIAALSFLENGVGIPSLIELARSGGSAVRHSAVFWLGQSGDRRALAALHTVIENAREDERIRSHAIFSLAHGGDNPDSEFAWLRALYPRLQSPRLKEAVIQGMGQDETAGSTWLLERARDASETMKLRKSALFWAGQREATPTTNIVAFYRAVSDPDLREHTIFVLSQRQDDAAITELLRIARTDSDRNMRSKALFWLGQKDDPRVANLISERLAR
jgi:HEAT repeat protein